MVLRKEITDQIKDVLKENPQGLNIKEIVKAVNINRNTVGRYLENLLVSGQVEMRRFGMAKIYMLSHRVPLSSVLSLSSELVMQLDNSLRIIFVNEPFLKLIETTSENLIGKNIEYSSLVTTFYDSFPWLLRKIQDGLNGKETSGEISPQTKNLIFFFRIAPTVFENGRKGVSVILEDITQRKQSENALLESEVKLRSITENSPDLILLLNPKLEIIFINRTIELSPEQVHGKPVFDFLPQEFHHAAAASFEHVLKTGELSIYGTEYHFANKETLYYESTVGPVFQNGTVTALVVNAHDITKRRNAEKVIQESEDRYRKLVEISPNPVLIHQQKKIIFINPAALTLLGASHADEVIGKNVIDFIQPEFREAVGKNIEKDLEGQFTPTTELHMSRLDGTSIIVEGRGVKTTINDKPAIQVALRDITKQKQTEEILRKSEKMYRSLVETTGTGYVVIDRAGRVISANKEYIRLTGRSSLAEIEGRSVIDWTASYDIDRNAREIEQVFKNGHVRHLEIDYQRPDGSIQPIEINASVIQYDDPIILTLCRDIADRKYIERELRESEGKLTAILRSITDPMSMMDENLTIIWANEPAKQYFGNDIIGKKCYEAYHQRLDPCDPYPCFSLKAFRAGKLYHHETTVIDRLGEIRYFECTANVALRDASGKPVAVLEISRDITDQKKVEMALRESEATARALISAPTDSVILMDTKGIILAVNETAASRLGKRSDELVGVLADDLFTGKVARSRRSLISRVLDTKEMVRFEDERDGIWFDTVAYPILSETGDVMKVAIVARDITDQKNTAKQLCESERLYQQLLEQSFDAVAIHKDKKIVFLNERAATILGARTPKDLIGRSIFDFIHPDSRKDLEDRIRKLSASPGMPVPVLTEKFFRVDGTTVSVEVMAISFDNNGIPAIRVVFREIASIKQ
jgi:PAS domain S-box-containing protein